MQLCFDATRFGFGLDEAIEFAASKGVPGVEFAFEPFDVTAKTAKLSSQESESLAGVRELCQRVGVKIACIRLDYVLDSEDKKAAKQFQLMMKKLALVAQAVDCDRITFMLRGSEVDGWVERAADVINPVLKEFAKLSGEDSSGSAGFQPASDAASSEAFSAALNAGSADAPSAPKLKLLLSLSTPASNRGRTLRQWRPMEPQEWRDLIAHCPGLALSFSAADCAWQNINYLQILPGLVQAIEHVEANDVEINRELLQDSGLFGPLWWRYRKPGKGSIDWRQLIEALKMYDYNGSLSIHLDDEFVDINNGNLEESLDDSVKFFTPLLKY
jgi:sugar phosphate isomerase/epimerase